MSTATKNRTKRKLYKSKVYVRLRPIAYDGSGHDQNGEAVAKSLESYTDKNITLGTQYMFSKGTNKYNFPTKVLLPDASQQDVYDCVIPNLLDNVERSDVILLAYGQTGTGKTTTMFGFADALHESGSIQPRWGIIPRLVFDMFARWGSGQLVLAVSAIEFYTGKVVDLLADADADPSIGIDSDNKPAGHTRVVLDKPGDIMPMIQVIFQRRNSRSTTMNIGSGSHAGSSRSHCSIVFTILRSAGGEVVETCFNVVDLAGAERPGKVAELGPSGEMVSWMVAKGEEISAQDEGKLINYSLFEFGRQVKLAAGLHRQGKKFAAPRQACLPETKYLARCIDGRAFMAMIVCLSQAPQCGWETWFSLQYGTDLSKLVAPVVCVRPRKLTLAMKQFEQELTKATAAFEEFHLKHKDNDSLQTRRWKHVKRIEKLEIERKIEMYQHLLSQGSKTA